MLDIEQYDSQCEYWLNRSTDEKPLSYPAYFETEKKLEIPNIEHGYLLIGASRIENIIDEAIFEVVDVNGQIYGVNDRLARELVTTLEDRVLLEKKPDNQMVLSYVDKIEKYIQQRYEASKEIIIDRNKKKLENWLELRKEEYLLKTKDTSELDAIRARYETETDFRQKIELKKQIEDFEKKQQQLINLFHSEMTLMEEEAVQMQQEFVENVLKTPRLATKIVIKF
jgi:hypothetical protein